MSINAYRDENSVPTMIGVLNTDGVSIVRNQIDPSTHRLLVSNGTNGTDHGTVNAQRDENSAHCLVAVSSGDGQAPITLYLDSNGRLLIKST